MVEVPQGGGRRGQPEDRGEVLKVEPTGFTDGAAAGWERKRGILVGSKVWD